LTDAGIHIFLEANKEKMIDCIESVPNFFKIPVKNMFGPCVIVIKYQCADSNFEIFGSFNSKEPSIQQHDLRKRGRPGRISVMPTNKQDKIFNIE
jgi:hypothetical protein